MTIRTMDGQSESVASSATGNAGLTLGIIGTALAVLGGGSSLLGGSLLGANNNKYVTKDELDMSMTIAQKDSTIALLQSEKTTDAKLVEVYKASAQQDKDIRSLIYATQQEQEKVNASQMAWNATANTQMATMANQIANQQMQLASITTNVVPSNKVCDTGCGCCNN